jgi:hypothetical protein
MIINSHRYFFTRIYKLLLSPIIVLISFITSSSNALAVCPETNIERLKFQGDNAKRILETNDGRKYGCWWDRKAQSMKFQNNTYSFIIRCSEGLTISTHIDLADDAVIERNGKRELYQVEFLGDRYECDAKGETMIKSWRYTSEQNTLRQFDYRYIRYKW